MAAVPAAYSSGRDSWCSSEIDTMVLRGSGQHVGWYTPNGTIEARPFLSRPSEQKKRVRQPVNIRVPVVSELPELAEEGGQLFGIRGKPARFHYSSKISFTDSAVIWTSRTRNRLGQARVGLPAYSDAHISGNLPRAT